MHRAIAFLLIVLFPLITWAEAEGSSQVPRYVRVKSVEKAIQPPPLPFSGTVRAGENAPLAFQTSGRLQKRPAQVGQRVRSGTLLAVLNNPQLGPALNASKARVQELASRVSQSERDLARVRQLRDSGAATKEELEQVSSNHQALKASLALAKAERERARQLLNETRLLAPFAGQVTAVFLEPGQIVSPGQPVLALSGSGGLELEIGVPARLLPLLALGQPLPLSQFGQPLEVQGSVLRIAESSTAGQLNRVIVALPKHERLHAGANITVSLPSAAPSDLLAVPVRAVIDTGRGVPRVFRYVDGRVQSVQVRLHRVLGKQVLISGPLNPEDQVVFAGLAGLQDGEQVELLP